MGCACKDMAREIADYRKQIHDLRNCFIKRMSVDSETNDRRRKDYNQAIFFDMTVRYDDKGLGIVCIDYNYADQSLGDIYPYWLFPEQADAAFAKEQTNKY